jgi:regulation of enolase protein 1 (concanavalin A-like superfamily)
MPKQALSYSRLGRSYLEALEGRLLLAGIVSDDFNGASLDTSLWTLVDPVGDSTLSFDGAHALLGVPAGVDHSVWRSGNKSARLMQPAADEDLGVEVKFDSQPSGVYAQQGLIIEQNDGNFLRFDFYSSAMGLNLFAGSFVNGAPTKRLNTRIAGGTTLYMRVERQADVWALQYSYNGQAWTQAVSFTHVLNVSRVGVFVGNEGASPPAHTARIDHFFNTAAPIMPHD